MSAVETYQTFTASLGADARKRVESLIREYREDLLAARSEDARLRLVEDYIREARRLLATSK